MESNTEKTVLSRHDVAALLGISLGTVDNYSKEGVLRARKVKGRVFFFRKEVLHILESA